MCIAFFSCSHSTETPLRFPAAFHPQLVVDLSHFVCSLMHTSVFASAKVLGLRRSSISEGLPSSVGPPAGLLCAAPPPFVWQISVAGGLCCFAEQHWKGWLVSGNTSPPGTLLKPALLDANFPTLPSVHFYDFSSLIYSLLLSQSEIGDYFLAIVEKRTEVRRAG